MRDDYFHQFITRVPWRWVGGIAGFLLVLIGSITSWEFSDLLIIAGIVVAAFAVGRSVTSWIESKGHHNG